MGLSDTFGYTGALGIDYGQTYGTFFVKKLKATIHHTFTYTHFMRYALCLLQNDQFPL